MAKIRVIIVNYNGGALLTQCLTGLMAQSFTDFEAVLIDNNSQDDSIDVLPAHVTGDARLTIVRNKVNRGFAAANNQGVVTAETDFIACLNPDAVPDRDWLQQLLLAAEAYPDCDFFGSTQICLSKPQLADGLGDHIHALGMPWRAGNSQPVAKPYPSGEVFAPCAAAAFYRTARFRQLGGFTESYFCYCEDIDLAYRHRLMGGSVRQAGQAVVRHHGSAITGINSKFSTYYGLRNMVWTFIRCTPSPLFWLLLPLHFIALDFIWIVKVRQGLGSTALQAMVDGWSDWGRLRRERRAIQATRTLPISKLIRQLAWNPVSVLKHSVRWL